MNIRRYATAFIAVSTLILFAKPVSTVLAGPTGGNCSGTAGTVSDTACQNNGNTDQYRGMYAWWDDVNMHTNNPPTKYDHINNEVWFWTHTNESQWIEMGIRFGAADWYPPPYTGLTENVWFWADYDSQQREHDHFGGFTTWDSNSHGYEFVRDNSNSYYFDVLYDGNVVGVSKNQNSDRGYEAQVGMEISAAVGDNISWAYSATRHNQSLEVQAMAGGWSYWWYQNHFRAEPCGQLYSIPNCTNGSEPSTSEWDVNKPIS